MTAVYDPAVMPDVAGWVASQGLRLLFVYGEYDPWTAGAFELGTRPTPSASTSPDGTHGAHISALSAADRAQVSRHPRTLDPAMTQVSNLTTSTS